VFPDGELREQLLHAGAFALSDQERQKAFASTSLATVDSGACLSVSRICPPFVRYVIPGNEQSRERFLTLQGLEGV